MQVRKNNYTVNATPTLQVLTEQQIEAMRLSNIVALVARPDVEPPRMPMDYAEAVKGKFVRRATEFMTTISDEAMKHVPDAGNIFRYYP